MSAANSFGRNGLRLPERERISPLAARLGLEEEDAAAARREGERAEARGDHGRALDAFRIALFIEPTEPSSWLGMARAARYLGDEAAAGRLERAAEAVAELARRNAQRGGGAWNA